jgi:UDP-N-acetylglucosamine 2-epimerase
LKIFAGHELSLGRLAVDERALLLAGSWPEGSPAGGRWSLDDAIDRQHHWIDHEAASLAEEVAENGDQMMPSFAWLNAVKLRYFFVKLLRVVAFFLDVDKPKPGERLDLFLTRGWDEAYAPLFGELGRLLALEVRVHWIQAADRAPVRPLTSGWLRRLAARAASRQSADIVDGSAEARVVLCGNPRLLDPVCRELRSRGTRIWWLYERFAFKSWLRWRGAGVRQLVCDVANDRLPTWDCGSLRVPNCRGLDLSAAVACWLQRHAAESGARQAHNYRQIERHFERLRPTHLVLDEDGTPFNRAAIDLARRYDATSIIVQHGAPYVRFGFAPLEADALCAWGHTSREQFVRWGVPPQRIHVTGCPSHDRLARRLARLPTKTRANQFLFITTPPPDDQRPDLVTYHLTTRTYTELLRTALAAMADRPNAQVLVKLHPRDRHGALVRRVLGEFPGLHARITFGSLERCLRGTRCVLSCASSAAIEATLAGVPVIQLMPEGSKELLPAQRWGLLGTARNREQLDELLDWATEHSARGRSQPDPEVFENLRRSAAAHVVDVILSGLVKREAPMTVPAEALTTPSARQWEHA